MKILVSGATGFVGGTIARHLLDAGHSVRAMSRSTGKAMAAFAANEPGRRALADGRLTFVQADVTNPATLAAAVEGVDAVVQAAQFTGAPVEDPARGLTYMNVDRNGTLNLLGAIAVVYGAPTAGPSMARFPEGAPRFLYMSGIAVSADSPHTWNRAKWQAEEAIRGSGLDWTIVRGSWAYGPNDAALNRILGYSDYLPFVPIFGDGESLLTPVFVEDIGRLFALIAGSPDKSGRHHLRSGWAGSRHPERLLAARAPGHGPAETDPAHPQEGGQGPGSADAALPRAAPHPGRRGFRESGRRRHRRRPGAAGGAVPGVPGDAGAGGVELPISGSLRGWLPSGVFEEPPR